MFLFECIEVEVVVAVLPEIGDGDYPAGVHGLDVGTFPCDMAIFGGIIVTHDKMRDVWSEIILVSSSQFRDTLSNDSLQVGQLVKQDICDDK